MLEGAQSASLTAWQLQPVICLQHSQVLTLQPAVVCSDAALASQVLQVLQQWGSFMAAAVGLLSPARHL